VQEGAEKNERYMQDLQKRDEVPKMMLEVSKMMLEVSKMMPKATT
jgi:hypothetical protein